MFLSRLDMLPCLILKIISQVWRSFFFIHRNGTWEEVCLDQRTVPSRCLLWDWFLKDVLHFKILSALGIWCSLPVLYNTHAYFFLSQSLLWNSEYFYLFLLFLSQTTWKFGHFEYIIWNSTYSVTTYYHCSPVLFQIHGDYVSLDIQLSSYPTFQIASPMVRVASYCPTIQLPQVYYTIASNYRLWK